MTKLEEELCAKVNGLEYMAREMNAENGRLRARNDDLCRAMEQAKIMIDTWQPIRDQLLDNTRSARSFDNAKDEIGKVLNG